VVGDEGQMNGLGTFNGLDFAIAGAVALGVVYGVSRGAMRMLTSALSLIGGLYVASIYYAIVAGWVHRALGVGPTAASIIGYIAVFVVVFIAIEMAGNVIISLLQLVHMGWIDRIVGAAFGGAIAAVILGFAVMLMMFLLPANAELIKNSRLAPALLAYNESLLDYIPPQIKQDYEDKRARLLAMWQNQALAQRFQNPPPPQGPEK
jgi:membrane protein required for colicin V production